MKETNNTWARGAKVSTPEVKNKKASSVRTAKAAPINPESVVPLIHSNFYNQFIALKDKKSLRADEMQEWITNVRRLPQSLKLDELLEIMVELGNKVSSLKDESLLKASMSALNLVSHLAGQKLNTLSYAELTSKLNILCDGNKNISENCIHASFLSKWCEVATRKISTAANADLSSSANLLAKLKYRNNDFLAEWFRATESRINSMEPRDVSSSLKAYAKLSRGVYHEFIRKTINIISHSDNKNKRFIIDNIYSLAMLKDSYMIPAALIDPVINSLARRISANGLKDEDKHILLVAYQTLDPEYKTGFKFSDVINDFETLARESRITKSIAQQLVFNNIKVDSRGAERYPGARMEEYIPAVGARVDILIPGVNVVVQVDGPTHYFQDQTETASTAVNTKRLEKAGYTVVRVKSDEKEQIYLDRIDRAVINAGLTPKTPKISAYSRYEEIDRLSDDITDHASESAPSSNEKPSSEVFKSHSGSIDDFSELSPLDDQSLSTVAKSDSNPDTTYRSHSGSEAAESSFLDDQPLSEASKAPSSGGAAETLDDSSSYRESEDIKPSWVSSFVQSAFKKFNDLVSSYSGSSEGDSSHSMPEEKKDIRVDTSQALAEAHAQASKVKLPNVQQIQEGELSGPLKAPKKSYKTRSKVKI